METLPSRIGGRVKLLREALNLSGRKFAAEIGVNQGALSKVERGERELSKEMALAIYAVTECSIDYLFLGRRTNMPNGLMQRLDDFERQNAISPESAKSSDDPDLEQ